MATSNARTFLDVDGSSDALALEMFSGTVLEAFRLNTVFYDRSQNIINHKMLTSGNSSQFPIIADGEDPIYHTPGVELLGQNYAFGEINVTIDDILVAHADIPLDKSRISHFPHIEPVAKMLGRRIAEDLDSKIARTAILAARTSSDTDSTTGLTLHNGGNSVAASTTGDLSTAYPNTSTGAQAFHRDARQLARLMDEDNVPAMGRYLYVSPYIVEILQNDLTIFNRDVTGVPGDLNRRAIGTMAGFTLIQSNNIPSVDVTTGPSKYQGGFAYDGSAKRSVAIALCGAQAGNAAIGMVENFGLRSHMHFDERRNTTFLKSQLMIGLGVLAPYCAGEITVADA